MFRVLALYDNPIDPAAFRAHYEGVHLPLCAKLPGLRSMNHSFDVRAPDGSPRWFALWQGVFDDEPALRAALASPEGHAMVADVGNYASGGMTLIQYPDALIQKL